MTSKRRLTPIEGEQLPLEFEVSEGGIKGSRVIKRVLKKSALYKVSKTSKKVTLLTMKIDKTRYNRAFIS